MTEQQKTVNETDPQPVHSENYQQQTSDVLKAGSASESMNTENGAQSSACDQKKAVFEEQEQLKADGGEKSIDSAEVIATTTDRLSSVVIDDATVEEDSRPEVSDSQTLVKEKESNKETKEKNREVEKQEEKLASAVRSEAESAEAKDGSGGNSNQHVSPEVRHVVMKEQTLPLEEAGMQDTVGVGDVEKNVDSANSVATAPESLSSDVKKTGELKENTSDEVKQEEQLSANIAENKKTNEGVVSTVDLKTEPANDTVTSDVDKDSSEKSQADDLDEQESEEIYHEAPEPNDEGQQISERGDRKEGDTAVNNSYDEWANGGSAEGWVDANEESGQNDLTENGEYQEIEEDEEVEEEEEEEERRIKRRNVDATADAVSDADSDAEAVDGEEDELDADEIADNPAYIPKSPLYYMHDSRTVNEEAGTGRGGTRTSRADGKWRHDKFDERSQAPKSKRELLVRYGFDIRVQNKTDKTDANAEEVVKTRPEKAKEETNVRNDNHKNFSKAGRGGRGMTGRLSNERQSRDGHNMRNGFGLQHQNKSPPYTSTRGRGALNRGTVMSRGSRQQIPHNDHERYGEGRFRNQREPRDYPSQSRRSNEHAPVRKGRGGYSGGAGTGGSGDNVVSPSNKGTFGGGGKRYSKQRTAAAYGDQQRTIPVAQTTVSEVIPQIPVPAQPLRNPEWPGLPPTFQPAIRPLPPMQPPMPAPIAPIPAVTSVTPTGYRAANDTVYFDPSQQIIRGTVPPQPRAKKRLEIVPPAN